MAATTMAQKNRQSTMNMLEALNRHDINAMVKDWSPDVLDYGDGSGRPMGLDSIKTTIASWFKAFPDYRVEDARTVSDGEWVMVWGDWKGTWKGDFMGQKANGKDFKVNDVDIFRFNDKGQITEHHNIQPLSGIVEKVGMKMQ